MVRTILLLLPIACLSANVWAGDRPAIRFSQPTRIATAACTEFAWVSDLELCEGTVELIRRTAVENLGLSRQQVHAWKNGSAAEFLDWTDGVGEKGQPGETLIFYFVTHQLDDGRMRFARGPDLAPDDFVGAINRLAGRYDRVLFINDSCFGPALERKGRFAENVIRLYAAAEDEEAFHVRFDKGPYGLKGFLEEERSYLDREMNWNPEGMTFLGLITLKAGVSFPPIANGSTDLQGGYRRLCGLRDEYDEKVRQRKVPHLVLVPPNANMNLLSEQK